MKELKGVDENTVIHCRTQDEWDKVCSISKITFESIETLPYGDVSCIEIEGPFYGYVRYFQEKEGKKIITAAEFIRLNTPEIPEHWCVRRTPENAEVLNAWYRHRMQKGGFKGSFNHGFVDCTDFCFLYETGENWDLEEHALKSGKPEITFEQWQTIPEHAEWLRDYRNFKYDLSKQVEEREIIGYEPAKPFLKQIGINGVWTLHANGDWYQSENGSECLATEFFERIIKAGVFMPVYAEKPVFKVGDWVTVKQGNHDEWKTFQVGIIDENMILYKLSNFTYYDADSIRLATPEEIEAARPKRKYMKQRWKVVEWNSNDYFEKSEKFDTKSEADAWVLENSIEGNEYEIKPFEVVAYE